MQDTRNTKSTKITHKKTKAKPKPTLTCKNCSRVCVSLCTIVVHNDLTLISHENIVAYPIA